MREKLSTFYLDIAGKLPKFQGGWIARLQDLRESQKKEAEECLQQTKKPEGNDLAFHSLDLYEVYILEDYEKLRGEFDKIYSQSSKNTFNLGRHIEQYNDFIDGALKGFLHAGSSNLGIIVSDSNPKKFLDVVRLKEFPEEIELIAIELFQIIPSIIVVKFDIKFKDEVINKLDRLINSRCCGKIIFTSFFPWRYGYRRNIAENDKRKIINEYFIDLQIICEDFLRRNFKGYFLANSRKVGKPACPVTGIFSINDLPETEEEFDKKMQKESLFWRTLGFEWYDKFNIFRSGDLLFFACSRRLDETGYPYRVLIKKKNLKINGFGDIENAITYNVADFIRGYIHPMILVELFKRILNQVNTFRIIIGRRILPRSMLKPSLARLLFLDQLITQERFIFNRLSSDFNYVNSRGWLKFDVTAATSLKDKKFPTFPDKKLFESLIEEIDMHISLIKEQYDTLNKGFKDYLAGKNLRATYDLQGRMFWLTVILVILAIIQMLPEAQRQNILSSFFNIFKCTIDALISTRSVK